MSNFTTKTIDVKANTPKIFQIKEKVNAYTLLKKSETYKDKSVTNANYLFKPKHFPPYITEWANSIYCYNNNIVKQLPSLDVNAYNLVKSYFNLYIVKYNEITRTKRSRIRRKKSSTKRLIAGKPSLKHTNDKVNIIISTYDRNSIYYMTKIANTLTIDQIRRKKYLYFFKNLRDKFISLKHKTTKSSRMLIKLFNKLSLDKEKLITDGCKSLKILNKIYLNDFINKVMWNEIISIRYKQCICFEQSKYEEQHAQLLIGLLEKIYDKQVVLDIVNLKSFYNSSSIFSNALVTKLKMKKNRVVNVLGYSLDTFNIPPIDRVKVYDEMYNRKVFKQNAFMKNIVLDNKRALDNTESNDIIDRSLSKDSQVYSFISPFNEIKQKKLDMSNINLNRVIESLKNKFTKGIRVEVAGRLTKRNTAQRSIYKLRYKGNIRNVDSSMKNLSTVLLRGHAKSNLTYTRAKSRLRIGAFGLKTWISSD